jgi:transmembrane sensor
MERINDIEEAASEWLIRRDSGRWRESDQARLDTWLEESTEHRVAFLRLELSWDQAARLRALGAGIPGDRPPPPGQWNFGRRFFPPSRNEARRVPPRSRVVARAAAGVFLSAIVGLGAYLFAGNSGEQYVTPIGGLANVPIEDGSRITLNTNSQLQVALTPAVRHIALEQGEAFFEVARDPNRPFVVEAGGQRIVAVGTKFSVRRDGDSIEVVVTEGKVRMEVHEARAKRAGATQAPVFLTAGYIAHSNAAGLLVQHKSLEEAENRLSWRMGVLTFRDLALGEAVAEFNRYNSRKIVIADPAVAVLKVEGNFRPTQSQAFVRLLESGFPVRASNVGENIVLASK